MEPAKDDAAVGTVLEFPDFGAAMQQKFPGQPDRLIRYFGAHFLQNSFLKRLHRSPFSLTTEQRYSPVLCGTCSRANVEERRSRQKSMASWHWQASFVRRPRALNLMGFISSILRQTAAPLRQERLMVLLVLAASGKPTISCIMVVFLEPF